jgi:hypothetical protein
VKSFLVLFFKKEPLAFWAGTEATPIPQASGSRPVGITQKKSPGTHPGLGFSASPVTACARSGDHFGAWQAHSAAGQQLGAVVPDALTARLAGKSFTTPSATRR